MKTNPTEQAYSELQAAYNYFNQNLFDGELPNCLLTFQRKANTMGYFSHKRFYNRLNNTYTDELALNPEYFSTYPLVEIFQTIVHEQCHLWQYHYGTPSRKTYHNQEWAEKMESIGLMPSSTGQKGGKKTGQKIADYIIPNGKLQCCIYEFLKSGGGITWFDRFGAKKQYSDTQNNVIESWLSLAISNGDLSTESVTDSDSQEQAIESLQDSLPALSMALGLSQSPNLIEPIFRTTQSNSNSKNKYSCKCGNSIWGRTGLKVICAECDNYFRES